MTRLELYAAPQSTCSQRVRFVLHAKGLAFEERRLDLFAGDQLQPEYLKLNPNGVVPTLIHDGAPVVDSSVIRADPAFAPTYYEGSLLTEKYPHLRAQPGR
jgi:Glutathione S-transferase, N-terminal domain